MEISKGEESRRLIIASIIFALILSMFLPAFLPPASATSGTVSDQSSCTSVGGFWSSGSCHVGNPSQYVLNAGDTLTIASGILFEIDGELHNFGTINNFGTLLDSGSNGGQLINENGHARFPIAEPGPQRLPAPLAPAGTSRLAGTNVSMCVKGERGRPNSGPRVRQTKVFCSSESG